MRVTAGEVETNSQVTYSCGPPHMDEQRQNDQLEPTYNSSVPIQDVALKTDRGRWTIETGGGRGSGRSMLAAQHDDDDDDDIGSIVMFPMLFSTYLVVQLKSVEANQLYNYWMLC